MNAIEEMLERLNRAFGAKPGGQPTFRAEDEGDDYLFGPPPAATPGENREEQNR